MAFLPLLYYREIGFVSMEEANADTDIVQVLTVYCPAERSRTSPRMTRTGSAV